MTARAICGALLLSVLPAAGCGTVANLSHINPEDGGRVPFGGVKRDLAVLNHADGPGLRAHHTPEAEVYPRQSLAVLCALDLPFSFVGDVLTWPYTAAYSIVNEPVPTPLVTFADAPGAQPQPLAPAPIAPKTMPIPVPPTLPAAPPPPVPPEALPKLPPLPDALPKPVKLP